MSEPKKPLIGYMILEEWCDDMSHWDGVISFPDPTGSNLAWENPIAMIEKSAYDKLKAENARLRQLVQDVKYSISNPLCMHKAPDSVADNANIVESIREILRGKR